MHSFVDTADTQPATGQRKHIQLPRSAVVHSGLAKAAVTRGSHASVQLCGLERVIEEFIETMSATLCSSAFVFEVASYAKRV